MRTVLIVDDNRDTREALKVVLQSKGYRVETAAAGPDALRYLRSGGVVSVIVLDRRMPGMSGDELHEELQHDPKLVEIPVVVFSALDDDRRLQGVAAYIRKAVHPDILLDAIGRACESAPSV